MNFLKLRFDSLILKKFENIKKIPVIIKNKHTNLVLLNKYSTESPNTNPIIPIGIIAKITKYIKFDDSSFLLKCYCF